MTPLERYLALKHSIERLSHYSGFNPFVPTWKFDRHRMSYFSQVVLSLLVTFYSMYKSSTGIDIVKRSMGLGIFLQSLLKGFLLISGAEPYQQLIAKIEALYRSKEKETQDLLAEKVNLCEKIYKVISIINSSAVTLFICIPLIFIIWKNEWIMMFPYFFPYLDTETYFGYIVTFFLHAFVILYTLLFHNAFDIAFICFTVHAVAMVDLITIEYEKLIEFLNEVKVEDVSSMNNAREKVKRIIEAQREFDAYVDQLNNMYKWPCFVTSSTSIFSICVALILIMIVKWPMAYGLCWALFGQLFAAYINGEVIHFQYGRLSNLVYELPWYMLRVSEQKMLILMIQKAARPTLINLLFIGPLNLETFTTICNAIYSYYNICETLLNK